MCSGVSAEEIEERGPGGLLASARGIVVPGGFGPRGVEGMVDTAAYARERGVPYLGLCLGLQVMVIEAARNALGLPDANSTEFDPDTGAPRRRPHARPEGRDPDGRHHEARHIPLPSRRR